MNRNFRILTACGAALVASAALAGQVQAQDTAAAAPMVHADVIGLDGKPMGTVMLQDTTGGVLVTTDLKGIPAGDHGFHFHEKGVCEPAQKFTTAGGHFTGGDHKHGLMVMGGRTAATCRTSTSARTAC